MEKMWERDRESERKRERERERKRDRERERDKETDRQREIIRNNPLGKKDRPPDHVGPRAGGRPWGTHADQQLLD